MAPELSSTHYQQSEFKNPVSFTMNNTKGVHSNNTHPYTRPDDASPTLTTKLRGNICKRKKWIQRLSSPESHFLLLKKGMKLLWKRPKKVSIIFLTYLAGTRRQNNVVWPLHAWTSKSLKRRRFNVVLTFGIVCRMR